MTALDKTARRAALSLIAKYGKSITLTTVTAGAYNPSTGVSTPTEVAATVKAIIEEYNGWAIANNLVEAGDKKVSIAASALAARPSPTDKLTIDGKIYTIVSVKAYSSGTQDALYELQARSK